MVTLAVTILALSYWLLRLSRIAAAGRALTTKKQVRSFQESGFALPSIQDGRAGRPRQASANPGSGVGWYGYFTLFVQIKQLRRVPLKNLLCAKMIVPKKSSLFSFLQTVSTFDFCYESAATPGLCEDCSAWRKQAKALDQQVVFDARCNPPGLDDVTASSDSTYTQTLCTVLDWDENMDVVVSGTPSEPDPWLQVVQKRYTGGSGISKILVSRGVSEAGQFKKQHGFCCQSQRRKTNKSMSASGHLQRRRSKTVHFALFLRVQGYLFAVVPPVRTTDERLQVKLAAGGDGVCGSGNGFGVAKVKVSYRAGGDQRPEVLKYLRIFLLNCTVLYCIALGVRKNGWARNIAAGKGGVWVTERVQERSYVALSIVL